MPEDEPSAASSQLLKWFGVALFGFVFLVALALTPLTGGFMLVVAVPALALALWLIRNDPGEQTEVTIGGFIALGLGVAVVGWVIFALLTNRTIWGAPQ